MKSKAPRAGDSPAAKASSLEADRQAWQAEQKEWLANQARLEQRTTLLEQQLQAQLHETSLERQALLDERTELEEQKQSWADERAALERKMESRQADLARRETELNQRDQQLAADAQELNRLQQLFSRERTRCDQATGSSQASIPSEDELIGIHSNAAEVSDIAVQESDDQPAGASDDIFARLRAMSLLKDDANTAALSEKSRSPAGMAESWRTSPPSPAVGGETDSAGSLANAVLADTATKSDADNPTRHADDQSIDDYMASLMARVRGLEPPSPAPRAPAKPQTETKTIQPAQSSEPAPTRVLPPKPVAAPPPPVNLEPRTAAPEKSANLAAMRQLANFTARAAIAAHHNRHGLIRIWRTLSIGAGLLVVGLVLLFLAIQLQSWYILVAAVAIGLSSVWFFRAYHLSQKLKLRRRKAEREPLAETADASVAPSQQSE